MDRRTRWMCYANAALDGLLSSRDVVDESAAFLQDLAAEYADGMLERESARFDAKPKRDKGRELLDAFAEPENAAKLNNAIREVSREAAKALRRKREGADQ